MTDQPNNDTECPFESSRHHEQLVRRLGALVRDETEALLVVTIVERACRSGLPVTWDTARSIALGPADQGGRHRRTASLA